MDNGSCPRRLFWVRMALALGHDTRVPMNADVVADVQFADYFAGISVREWSIAEAPEANGRLYGTPYSNRRDRPRPGLLPPAAGRAIAARRDCRLLPGDELTWQRSSSA